MPAKLKTAVLGATGYSFSSVSNGAQGRSATGSSESVGIAAAGRVIED